MSTKSTAIGQTPQPFDGFEPLTANFIYCPNQFFDVCLPHCSRGAVRFVAYLLRRTLGWRDEDGNPIEEDISVPHQDFIHRAGISKGAIGDVCDEVIASGFVRRTQTGKAKSSGDAGQPAGYRLQWDARGVYITDPNAFQGFYAGGGNCSPIPNAFFDQIVPWKRLGVTKVVGTVLRHTVGFESKYGGRRQQASLSLSFIQRYANIKDRTTAVSAVRESLDANFIRRVDEGCFDSRSNVRRAATYAPTWLREATKDAIGSKTLPTINRFKNPTSIGTETRPAKRYRNPTSRKTDKKHTHKQQTVVVENSEGYELLVQEGIGEGTARRLSETSTLTAIKKQIGWLDFRSPKNRPAMLQRAVEEQWSEPDSVVDCRQHDRGREREEQENAKRIAREAVIAEQKQAFLDRRTRLLARWNEQSEKNRRAYRQKAAERATNGLSKRLIRKSRLDNPTLDVLEVMALAIAEPIGESH